ncbi:NAD-binding protein [Ottowia sp.]|uniref:NAD-binding protein n=1 Tax=Ottowia sp. TaxID=1898956 RepID=UPI0025DD78F2|nr:NAD-binding protein [Ottowia sp.]MBK6616807.1 NAD-binding protein [Ottowia sp.]
MAKATKVINNLLVGVVTLINAEALSMGVSAGLDITRMVDLLSDGIVGSTVLRSYMGRYVRDGRYGDGLIGHRLMAKDLALAAELADQVGAPAHFARLGRQLYLTCSRTLGPNAQFPSAFDYFRGSAGAAHTEGTS